MPYLTEVSNSAGLKCWCREGESNPQGTKYRRILSPLRLPVPPSRHFVEVLGSRAAYLLIHIGPQGDECETVKQSVEVFDNFHSFGSRAREVLFRDSRAQSPLPSHKRAHP